LGQALAVFQAFSLAKLRISRKLSQNFSFGKGSIVLYQMGTGITIKKLVLFTNR
jgi:hypothetical protein